MISRDDFAHSFYKEIPALQEIITINHHKRGLQEIITINHHKKRLQEIITINHHKRALQEINS